MSKIKMTPEVLRQSSKKIEGYQSEIQKILRKIDVEVMSMDNSWTGLSQQSFSGNYQNVRPFMSEYSRMVYDTCKKLKSAADAMEAADRNLGNSINKNLATGALDFLSGDLWKDSYYSRFDPLTKVADAASLAKQIKYFKDGSYLQVVEEQLASGPKRYAYVYNPNNPGFREEVLDGLGRFGQKYDLDKIKTWIKEGRSLTPQQALLAEKFIPSTAAINGAKSTLRGTPLVMSVASGGIELYKDIKGNSDPSNSNKKSASQIAADVSVELGTGVGSAAACAAIGAAVGSAVPVAGTLFGAAAGFAAGILIDAGIGAKSKWFGGGSLKDLGKAELGKAYGAIGDSINSISNKLKDIGNGLLGSPIGCILGG